MSSTWQQIIAALAAAVIPVLTKFLNDWLDTKKAAPTETPAS